MDLASIGLIDLGGLGVEKILPAVVFEVARHGGLLVRNV
jgi:hypothetical protein